jgi:hypothetical protein
VRKSESALREQASFLNLTHDGIFARRMDDVITYWNRGAEEFYRWTAEEAVGKSHQLLQAGLPSTTWRSTPNCCVLAAGKRGGPDQGRWNPGGREAGRWSLQSDER